MMSGNKIGTLYLGLTEISGDLVAQEQIKRMFQRYYWAASFCNNANVLETSCGTGQGFGLLKKDSKQFFAGDYSLPILNICNNHYKSSIPISRFDAQYIPFASKAFDIVINFEAIYYIPDPILFFKEAWRVLKPGGKLLISTANKDLFDFNPSPHSYRYFGVTDFYNELGKLGFIVNCFGDTPTDNISLRQKILRPIKKTAVALNLVPKTMNGKRWLKRIFFGNLVPMPKELNSDNFIFDQPTELDCSKPDKKFKVIHCKAEKPLNIQ